MTMPKVVLRTPATIAGVKYEVGAEVEVSQSAADFLLKTQSAVIGKSKTKAKNDSDSKDDTPDN